MPTDEFRGHRLRQQVGRVLLSGDLVQGEVSGADPLLHPQLANCKVANLADASAPADADSGTAVCVDMEVEFDPQVQGQALYA